MPICTSSIGLRRSGIDYDVITDDVLHEEGANLLNPYRCIVTGSHPEYHTARMLDGIEGWLGAGGRLVYWGGMASIGGSPRTRLIQA